MHYDKKQRRLRRAKRQSFHTANHNKLRISIFRSCKHIYATLCDEQRKPVMSVNSTQKEFISLNLNRTEISRKVGIAFGDKFQKTSYSQKKIWFDRRGFRFHGRVKAVADGIKSTGLNI